VKRIERLLAWLLARTGWLPVNLRSWAQAVRSEADALPSGRPRVRWLLGGVWFIVRQRSSVLRAATALIFVLLGAVAIAYNWHPGTTVPGRLSARVAMFKIVLALLVIPLLAATGVRWLGPPRTDRVVVRIRTAAYLGVWALLMAVIAITRFGGQRFENVEAHTQAGWTSGVVIGAITGGLPLFAVFAGYTALVFISTSERSSAAPGSVAVGALVGLVVGVATFALAPYGGVFGSGGPVVAGILWVLRAALWLCAPVLAGCVAASRLDPAAVPASEKDDWRSDGAVAGLWTGLTGALVVTTLTLVMMRLHPDLVPLKWANPDPNVPHGTPYEIQMSVSDGAETYLPLLILAPIIGPWLGAAFSRVRVSMPTNNPAEHSHAAPAPNS
jgi:hypothetical protein